MAGVKRAAYERGQTRNGATQTADTSPQPKPAIVENIKRALAVLFSAGDVTELRILNTRYKTVSGYFDDLGTLDSAGAEWSGQAPAVYVKLNPVNPALLARSKNRVDWIECHIHG